MGLIRRVIGAAGAVAVMSVGLVAMPQAVSADPGDYGIEGPSFSGRPSTAVSEKPQSRLWHRDGVWFGVLYGSASGTWNIFRLDGATEQWIDTGVVVDGRANTSADALWDGTHLYVASHVVTVSTDNTSIPSASGTPAKLSRYSYVPATQSFAIDAGFPTNINDNSSEALTIAKDSLGQIWATWTQVGSAASGYATKVYVNATSGNDSAWGTPYVLPVPGVDVEPDDISAIVAFDDNRIGVLWSNQADEIVYWASRSDRSPLSSWAGAIASSGNNIADDHLNLKSLQSDSHGRVYAAVKTSLDGGSGSSAQLNLLVFTPSTTSWTTSLYGTVNDCHTRPLVMIDETHQVVHMFATGPSDPGCPWSGYPGTIYGKSAPMSNPVFAPGRGTPVLRDESSSSMNDVSSTKQSVNLASGLVVLAANYGTKHYWHANVPLSEPDTVPDPAPVGSFTPSVVSGDGPLSVQFTDSSSNSPTSWARDFGDGATSTLQNPQHTFTTAGQCLVSLVASNASGSSAAVLTTITVLQPGGDAGGLVVVGGSSSAESGGSALETYYDRWQPTTAAEVLGISSIATGEIGGQPPAAAILPWEAEAGQVDPGLRLERVDRWNRSESRAAGEALDLEHGHKHFGPVSPALGRLEFKRYAALADSVRAKGFVAKVAEGYIGAQLLVGHGSTVAAITGPGLHRAIVGAASGVDRLILAVDKSPALVHRDDVERWPGVRCGLFTSAAAVEVFDRMIAGVAPGGHPAEGASR